MGSNLSASDIATLASNAGFEGDSLVTATAIGLAESGGNPNAYNPEVGAGTASGQGSYGIWQVYLADHPTYTPQALLDPQTNATAAYSISSNGTNFSPWSTYNSGAFQQYLQQAQDAVSSLFGTSSAPDTTDSTDTDDSGGGATPDTTGMLILFAAGGLAIWALAKAFGS